MEYGRSIPPRQQLIRLTRLVPFPATREEMIATAKRGGFGASLILFLRIFDLDDSFENASDFIQRCEEVMLFLHEDAYNLKEFQHLPQE